MKCFLKNHENAKLKNHGKPSIIETPKVIAAKLKEI